MKFDVNLIRETGGITTADVPWATDVPAAWLGNGVRELAERMEQHPDAFQGKIVITPVEEPLGYHGSRHVDEEG
jgi:hypothetical protein